jgi:nicotinamide mononucleotide adenylyltransferase/soluble cytochrome b562
MNELTKHLVEGVINEIAMAPIPVFIYSGHFQPPHLGNKWVWDWLAKTRGADKCFIATPSDASPLTFAEKKSVFAAMGMDSSKVNQSIGLFRAPSITEKFDVNKYAFVYVVNEVDAGNVPPRFKPYKDKMVITPHILGESYYMVVPKEAFTVGGITIDDEKVIKFLGSPKMDYKTSMEAFHKFFGFFDEHMFNVLVKKFEKTVKEDITPIVQTTEQSSSLSPQFKAPTLSVSERASLAERMGVEQSWVDELLTEDPDGVDDGDEVHPWDSRQAYPFFLIDDFLLVGRPASTHRSLIKALNFTPDDLHRFTRPNNTDSAFYVEKLKSILQNNLDYLEMDDPDDEFNGAYERDEASMKFVAGRLWKNEQIISFWSPKSLVVKNWETLKKAVSKFHSFGNLDDYRIDWIERDSSEPMTDGSSISSTSSNTKDDLSPEEYKKLLSKQHLDPNAKKVLAKMAEHPNKAAEIADKLGMSVAELNHLIGVVAEGATAQILKEDPDEVVDEDGTAIAYLEENDTRAFFFFDDVAIFSIPGGRHEELFNTIKRVAEVGRFDRVDLERMVIADGKPNKADLVRVVRAFTKYKSQIFSGSGRNIAGVLVGRVWTEKKLMSFWTLKRVAIKSWDNVEKIFQQFPNLLGNRHEYRIDWLERAYKKPIPPLTRFDNARDGAPEEKITPEKLKDLLSKQHLDPKAKEILKKVQGLPPNKAAHLATLLGFNSPAEMFYHHGHDGSGGTQKINEDPGEVYEKNKEILNYTAEDAVIFITLEDGTIFGGNGMLHEELYHSILSYIFKREWKYVENDGYFSDQKKVERYLIIKGKYLADHDKIQDDGRSPYKGLAGRIWTDKRVISFWQTPEETRPHWKKIEEAFARDPQPCRQKDGSTKNSQPLHLGKLEEYRLDFVDSGGNADGLIPVQSFLSGEMKKSRLSPEEYKELLAKQHLDPEAKKKLAADLEGGPYNKAAELAKKLGYDSVAQMNADIHTNLDEKKLTESPDVVRDVAREDDAEMPRDLATYGDADATTFVAFENFDITTGMYHYHIFKALQEFDRMGNWKYADGNYMDFDKEAAAEYIRSDLPEEFDGSDVNEGREFPHALAGRLWTNKKIISFWHHQSEVQHYWNNVVEMFQRHTEFGSLDDYQIDWLERSEDLTLPLTKASTSAKPNIEKKTNSSVDKLDAVKKAMHVMDPGAKGQLMKMLQGASPNKKQEIADKLGISVAQLNAMDRMDEAVNSPDKPVIAIYSGRFQPFHINHYKAYQEMVKEFGKDNVFIVTSDKTEPGTSPFDFKQKSQIMTRVFGIPQRQIVEALHMNGDKPNRGPYFTIDKTAGKLSDWMKEIAKRMGMNPDNPPPFGLVIGFGGKDEARSRIAKSEYSPGKPVPNFMPEGNVMSFTIPMQDVNFKGHVINGTMVREIITKHPEMADMLFKILYPQGIDPQTKAMIVSTIQSSIAPEPKVKKKKLEEGVQFGFIKHIEDMSPEELLNFFKLWNADQTKFETFEKVDGNFYRFGLSVGKFYVKDSKQAYNKPEEYPEPYFYDDFRRFHAELQKIDWSLILKEVGAYDNLNFEADSEAVPHAHHNQVEYNGKIIGEGIVVIFGLTMDGSKTDYNTIVKFCKKANEHSPKIKFHAVPKVDLSKIKFDTSTVETLESLITKHGNFLKKPARKPEDKALKQKILGLIHDIAVKAKNRVFSTNIKSAFGQDYEGMVVHLPGGGMVKFVDKDKFTKSKDESWKVISDMDSVLKPIRDDMKKGVADGMMQRLQSAKTQITTIYNAFKKNPESVKSEKKREDTHKHYDLLMKQIDKALASLQQGQPVTQLRESGKAVGEVNPIPRSYLEKTVEHALNIWGFKGTPYELLGNINKDILGDIDVGIDYPHVEKVVGAAPDSPDFWQKVEEYFSKQSSKVQGREPKYKIMKGLEIVSVLSFAVDETGKVHPELPVQVDIAFGDMKFMKAGRSGAPKDSKYKALHRNILLADILSTIYHEQVDDKTRRRYQINISKGVQTADLIKGPRGGEKKANVKTIINDPDKMAELLFGPGMKWEDMNSFEKLYKLLVGPKFRYKDKVKEIVDKFKDSMKRMERDVPSELA